MVTVVDAVVQSSWSLCSRFLWAIVLYLVVAYPCSVWLTQSPDAGIVPLVFIVVMLVWRRWLRHWIAEFRTELNRIRSANEAAEVRTITEAWARMAALEAALAAERSRPAPKPYTPGMAFDADVQQANGMPMYHTHYISPEHQRYLEEWFPDDEGSPSLKAGVYVTPITVTGPQRIDAPPQERPFYIPVKRTEPRRYAD